jgi:hypothetical protein
VQRGERAVGQRRFVRQPCVEPDRHGRRGRHVGIPLDCEGVRFGEELGSLSDRHELDAFRHTRLLLVTHELDLLDLTIDLLEAEASGEGERARVGSVDARRRGFEADVPEVTDELAQKDRADPAPPCGLQHSGLHEPPTGRVGRAREATADRAALLGQQVQPARVALAALPLLLDGRRLVRRDRVPDGDIRVELVVAGEADGRHRRSAASTSSSGASIRIHAGRGW